MEKKEYGYTDPINNIEKVEGESLSQEDRNELAVFIAKLPFIEWWNLDWYYNKEAKKLA